MLAAIALGDHLVRAVLGFTSSFSWHRDASRI
jgi:hypothetical protein